MNEKINIKRIDGSIISADLICFMENTTTNKRYVYYTLNETVGTGDSSTVKIYVSKIQQNNPTLDVAISEEDWNKLKGYMGDTLKGINNPEVKYIPLNELGEPTSISEKAIAMPVAYDYINKQKGAYSSMVATANIPETPEPVSPAPVVPEPTVTPTSEPIIAPVAPEMTIIPTTPETIAPAPVTETIIPTAEPIPMEPIVQPVVEATIQMEPIVAPVVEAPIVPEVVAPVAEPSIVPEVVAPTVETPMEPIVEPTVTPVMEETVTTNTSTTLTPIDLNIIEQKYAEMYETLNKLKEQELEAAKRYNATLELSSMHKEQHANYVQNEQIKETSPETLIVPNIGEMAPTAPIVEQPMTQTPIATPVVDNPMSATPTFAAPIEPTPVTPVVPQPVSAAPIDIETNWFDMPANTAQ